MKKVKSFLAVCFILIFDLCSAQWQPFSNPVRLTNGNNDKNPSFKNESKFFDSGLGWDWEFLAFERVSGNSSAICVGKIDYYGPVDSAVYLTNDNFRNTNPEISYNKYYYSFDKTPKYGLAIWESDKLGSGRSALFASRYIRNTGWSAPFAIDTSLSNNISPKIQSVDSTIFLIVYESSNQIKYKKYDILTNSFSSELTLTSGNPHHSPYITSIWDFPNSEKVYISFEKELSTSHRAIYFRTGTPDSIPLTENPADTIAYAGVNYNQGFHNLSFSLYNLFLSDRNGNFNIYGTSLNMINNSQLPIITNSTSSVYNYSGVDYPITDDNDQNSILNYFYTYTRNGLGKIEIIFKNSPFSFEGDSLIDNISHNQNYQTKSSIGTAIHLDNSAFQRYWIVYNKDSSDSNYPSRIFGVNFTNSLSSVNNNLTNSAGSFELSQNYPNPFNPTTNLEFGISKLEFVTLKVYDMLGNEVATLVNESKPAGNYSINFDGSNLSSGIYFYKLIAGDFSQVKKMTLLK